MFEQYLMQLRQHMEVREVLIAIKQLINDEKSLITLKNTAGYSVDIFEELLGHEDAKVRKNAALILGMINEPECVPALIKAYEEENTLFVKSSYLTAITAYDFTPYRDRLKERMTELESANHSPDNIKHIAKELKILHNIFIDEKSHSRHVFAGLRKNTRVILTCRKETSDKLADIMSECRNISDIRKIFCGISCVTRNIDELSRIRIYRDIVFPVNGMRTMEKSEIPSNIVEGDLVSFLKEVHNTDNEPFYFRISAKSIDVADMAARIEALSGGRLVNSVSDYEVEIRLIASAEGKFAALVKLFTIIDNRFSYRINHIAASIHPVNAATVMELSKDYLKRNAQILDPFCGVGTMLIERNKAVPAKYIYGTDIYGRAIESARENAFAAGMNINFINRNYFDFRHEYPFDEIISNMPAFDSREEADVFYGRFFKKTKEILKKQGVMIIYSGEKNLIKKHLRLNSNFKLFREFTMNEKEENYIFIIGRN